jgi:hypothetical protein
MKIIITESQFNMVIPKPLRRRLDGLEDLMYDIMMNNGMSLEAPDYDVEDFVNYVIDIMMYDIFPDTLNKEIPTYEHLLIYFLGDKIREFWKKNQ